MESFSSGLLHSLQTNGLFFSISKFYFNPYPEKGEGKTPIFLGVINSGIDVPNNEAGVVPS
jgi:hypothetical protein